MKKGEWMETFALMPPPTSRSVGILVGEYQVAAPIGAEIMAVGLEDYDWIVVITRNRSPSDKAGGIESRKILVLGDGHAIEYQYTRYIGSVNVSRIEGNSAWRHVFEITRPNDDEEPVKKDGKVLLAATPGC